MSNLLEGFPVITEIPVAWGEMDALNHVNNVVYFRYFETARLDYFADIGLMEEMQVTQTGPVLSETSSRYRRPVTYPDNLLVGSRVSELAEDSFVMEYKIVSKQQCRAQPRTLLLFEGGHVQLQTAKACEVEPDIA